MEPEAKEELLLRLRNIEGHIRSIERMLGDDRACVDVVRQTLAAKRALERVSQLLVASHLRACVGVGPGRDPDGERERAVQELLDVLHLSGRL
jgi:DNA-binding FrmR family transcriptional regulator